MNYDPWLPRTVHYTTEDDEGEDCVCVCGGGGWRYKLPRNVHYATEDDEGEDSVCVWGGGGGLEVETAQERPLRH